MFLKQKKTKKTSVKIKVLLLKKQEGKKTLAKKERTQDVKSHEGHFQVLGAETMSSIRAKVLLAAS
jgi:Asp/Glu/hydantoin racemase